MTAWVAIIGVALGTYALRASMFLAMRGRSVPAWAEQPMSLVGPAAIAALVASLAFVDQQHPGFPQLPEIAALVAAFVAVRRTGNVMHAFAVGMPVFWLLIHLN